MAHDKGNLRLAHVHGSASQDIPLEPFLQTESTFTEESDFFDFMEKLASAERNLQKLTIRDCEKNHRCLFPSEILYLKAAGRHCIFYTKTGSFQAPRPFYPPMNKKCRNRSSGSTKVIWLTICILIVSPAIMQCLRTATNFTSVKSATWILKEAERGGKTGQLAALQLPYAELCPTVARHIILPVAAY